MRSCLFRIAKATASRAKFTCFDLAGLAGTCLGLGNPFCRVLIVPYPSRWRGVLLRLVFMIFSRQAKASTCCTQTHMKHPSKKTVKKTQGINVTGFTESCDYNAACIEASADATAFFLSWQPKLRMGRSSNEPVSRTGYGRWLQRTI